MSQGFHYSPLKGNEIRLLCIDTIDANDQTHAITLCHYDLEDAPSYLALSYTWEDPSLRSSNVTEAGESVQINGGYFGVGLNLGAALRALRVQAPLFLWADAICIDQSSFQERGRQVLRMRDIYERASKVFVWLGVEADDSDIALEFVEQLSSLKEDPVGLSHLISSIKDRKHSQKWRALQRMLDRGWWTRTWVVQEVAVAKVVDYACGLQHVSGVVWYNAIECLSRIWSLIWTLLRDHEDMILNVPSIDAISCQRTLRLAWKLSGPPTLLYVLYRTASSNVSVPHDKLYGVLGLASDAAQLVPRPNYDLAIHVVYCQLVESYYLHYRRLDVLAMARPSKKSSGVPSWAPDWNGKDGDINPLLTRVNTRFPELAVQGFAAAKMEPAVAEFSGDLSILTCQGFELDEIDGLSFYPWGDTPDQCSEVQSKYSRNAYGSDAEVFRAIWRSLVGDRDWSNNKTLKAPEIFGQAFIDLCKRSDELSDPASEADASRFSTTFTEIRSQTFAGRTIRDRVLDERLPTSNVVESQQSASNVQAAFEHSCDIVGYKRRFLVTKNGYMGMGLGAIQSGDKICIILGCGMPVILRPRGDSYEFLGETYLHGIMYGEALEDPRRVLKVFRLI